MKHDIDYEDGGMFSIAGSAAPSDCIIYTTGHQAAAPRHGMLTGPERLQGELNELRRRIEALEALARYFYDQ